jgi:hypothetical protein
VNIDNCVYNTSLQKTSVDSIVHNINQQKYDSIYVDISDEKFSSEGGELIGLCDKNNQLHKLIVTYFGEMWKIYQEYYLYEGFLIYQTRIIYNYSKPFYMEDYTMTVDSMSYNCVIYHNKCGIDDFNVMKKLFYNRQFNNP